MTFSASVEAWRARGRMLRLREVDVFVAEGGHGSAMPLVMLHGFPTSSFDYHAIFDRLGQGRRVVTLDFPGFGFSDKPTSYGYSLFEQADVVELALVRLGVGRAHLFAHDMGTSITTELLARREAGLLHCGLESVVLMNGSVHIELAHLTPSQRLLLQPHLGPLLARLASRTLFRAQLRRILGPGANVADTELDDLFALVRHNDGHLRLPAIIEYVRERRRFARRWIGALERLDLPTLILWGLRDPVAVPAIAERLAAEIPDARLQTLDEIGHYPQLEAPTSVVEAVVAFHTAVEAGARGATCVS